MAEKYRQLNDIDEINYFLFIQQICWMKTLNNTSLIKDLKKLLDKLLRS